MPSKSELRSTKSGRPSGTFGEAVHRARAWHWLNGVLAQADTDDVTKLDKLGHPLSRGLTLSRRFERVQQDGYDPDRIAAKKTRSLLAHVSAVEKYKSTRSTYMHPLWKHLTERTSSTSGSDNPLRQLLAKHGLARLDLVDQGNGHMLGLIPDHHIEAFAQLEGRPELPLDADRIASAATLDSLQLLLLLYREAQDLANHGHATALGHVLRLAADSFAAKHSCSGEQLDTWQYLLHTRMLRWNPSFQPGDDHLRNAKSLLLEEFQKTEEKGRKGKRKAIDPETYTSGRAERRWRRQIWARACHLSLAEQQETELSSLRDHFYVDAALATWLVDNRGHISAHYELCVEFLMNGDPSAFVKEGIPWNDHPPLAMPESLFNRRNRPRTDEQSHFHFGEHLPYDVIPVTVVKNR